jgi:hypothetical protein
MIAILNISFLQYGFVHCTNVELVKKRLVEKGMRYVTALVEDEGVGFDCQVS